MPDTILNPNKEPVNAVYGYARFLCELLSKVDPSHIAVCFDESLSSNFRNKLYPAYKANREPAPAELKQQFVYCRQITKAFGLAIFSNKRYEADDFIASLASLGRKKKKLITVVSRDKDLLQVLKSGDEFWNYADDEVIKYHAVKKRKGVRAEQIADFLAIAGDAVDNIPGLPGVGAKTAIVLLDRLKSIDNIYLNLEKVKKLTIRGSATVYQKLKENKQEVYLFQKLTELNFDIPLKAKLVDLRWRGIKQAAVTRVFNKMGFGKNIKTMVAKLKIQ